MREALREAQAKVESYLTAINAVITSSAAAFFSLIHARRMIIKFSFSIERCLLNVKK